MDAPRNLIPLIFLTLLTLHISVEAEASGTTMTLHNKCSHTVWPGIQPSAGRQILEKGGGFKLLPNNSYTLLLPDGWSGRVWGRHGCSFNSAGRGRCATGDCGGALFCNGLGGTPPATLAEITLGKEQDFYDVSLVDGYNLAISLTPHKGSGLRLMSIKFLFVRFLKIKGGICAGKCSYAGCISDLNRMCPMGLQVLSRNKKRVVACKSACSAFNSPRYCCTGSFGSPQSCKPSPYSRIFKVACPKAYSYAYDDPTSIATCTAASYLLTFCPHLL